MRLRYRFSILLGLCVATAVGAMAPLGAAGARADSATLKKIASRIDGHTGIVTIEASDPVPYVASQPDPRVLVLELRDVVTAGFTDQFSPDPRNPVAAVQVESGQAVDGVDVARVRLTLSQAMRPRVRSSRNVIYVEADRTAAEPMINVVGPAAAIRDVRVMRRGQATAVSLLGTGRLVATSVQEETKGQRRLVIDLPNVTSAVQASTPINQGPVGNVRIGANPKAPVITQVVMDLSRQTTYRVESSPDGNDLTVVFDEPVADPVAALRAPAVAPSAPAASAQPVAAPVPSAPRPAARQQAAQSPSADAPAQSKYSGHPVSLDFQGADLRAVLRTFAEISGLNIVIDPTIVGTVDVALRDVPWDQALDIILRANKLGYVVDATIVRIAPLDVLAKEESERLKLQEAQAQAGELRVLTRALSYATAKDLSKLLVDTVLSKRGSIQTHDATNTLIINDLPDRLARASDLIDVLDVPQPQVEIEARIVQTTREFARQLGVQWGFNAFTNSVPGQDHFQGAAGGRTGAIQGPAPVDSAVNLRVPGATSALGVAVGTLTGTFNLDVALSAIEKQGQGRILSTPRVSTQNNIEAEITQGVQIPIQTVANNTVTVTFKDAALTLRVKPQITASNTVIMQIAVENASPDFSRQVNNIPPIDTQRANTRVLVTNGETTVIGGIYVSREQTNQDRTPGLHRVPLLGWLFKRDTVSDENRELLIFITPKIVRL
ncbi:MAG TPA: type IV pilus secretin PilQ [Vicinamibacterales bacterium]|nr:type IV pilus secretin PilQ [Vicinamibacterales bacterium]